MRFLILYAVVLAASGYAGLVHADIYMYTSADGRVSLTNVPSDSRYKVVLREPGKPSIPREIQDGSFNNDGGTRRLNRANQRRYRPLVEEAARAHQVETALLDAVISAESGYDPRAVSGKGAAGLMQLMPDTAKRYGVANRFDPAQNIQGGARYLKDLLQMFNQDMRLALAAYNAGEQVVARYGNRVPPYRETARYVPKVLSLYKKYRAEM